jgi:hypothetical protein
MGEEPKADREWLRRIVSRMERAENKLPEPPWLNGEWPKWVENVGRELLRTFHPTAKLKVSDNWEPGEVGAMLGQQVAYFDSLARMMGVPDGEVDWKKVQLVYGKDIKKRVENYERKLNEEFFPDLMRGLKFALALAIEQDYRSCARFFAAFGRAIERTVSGGGDFGRTNTQIYIALLLSWRSVEKLDSVPALHRGLCKIFGTHVVGDLKRIEKMCQRLELRFGRPGRPRKSIGKESGPAVKQVRMAGERPAPARFVDG